MLGGDERELILTRALLAEGARVFAVGYPKSLDRAGPCSTRLRCRGRGRGRRGRGSDEQHR